jgi:hypothetical protein
MAAADSPYLSYTDTAAQKKVITDVISLIDPSDAPLIERLGGLDGAAGKFRFSAWPGTNPSWLEDSLPGLSTALQVATIASNATSATVTDATLFQDGHIILIDAQTFWVSAVNTTTNVLTFASLGGTGASHATNTTISIIGVARLEGDDSDPVGFTTRATGSNYTQIWHSEIKASRTMAQMAQWGIDNEFDYQASKAVPGLMRLMEKQLFANVAPSAGSASAPRVMGALTAYITTNATTGATMTKASFDNAVKLAYASGGTGPWVAPVSPTNFAKVRGFYENSNYLVVQRDDAVVGMPPVQSVRTPFGDVELLLDRWASDSFIYIIDPKNAGLITYSPFTQEMLAKTGDSLKGEVVGEFSLCVRQNVSHALLTSVT